MSLLGLSMSRGGRGAPLPQTKVYVSREEREKAKAEGATVCPPLPCLSVTYSTSAFVVVAGWQRPVWLTWQHSRKRGSCARFDTITPIPSTQHFTLLSRCLQYGCCCERLDQALVIVGGQLICKYTDPPSYAAALAQIRADAEAKRAGRSPAARVSAAAADLPIVPKKASLYLRSASLLAAQPFSFRSQPALVRVVSNPFASASDAFTQQSSKGKAPAAASAAAAGAGAASAPAESKGSAGAAGPPKPISAWGPPAAASPAAAKAGAGAGAGAASLKDFEKDGAFVPEAPKGMSAKLKAKEEVCLLRCSSLCSLHPTLCPSCLM